MTIIKRTFIVCLLLLLCGVFSPIFAATPKMVEKNLFSQDRKPPLPQSESASSQTEGQGMAIGDIQLDGIVFRDSAKTAMLRLKKIPVATGNASSPFVSVRVGEMVNDYRVAKIDVQSVTLEKSGQTYTLGLFSPKQGGLACLAPTIFCPPSSWPEADSDTNRAGGKHGDSSRPRVSKRFSPCASATGSSRPYADGARPSPGQFASN